MNGTKTRLRRLPEESFDFLGYTIGSCHSPRTGGAYIGPSPSRKSIQRFCREISELTGRRWASRQVDDQVAEINRKLKGWANYFSFGYPTGVYWEIDWYVRSRLIRHLQRRSQRPYHPAKGEAWYSHLKRLGLVCLARPSESGNVHA